MGRGELRDLLLRRFQESGGVVRFGAKVVRVADSGDHAVAHLHDATAVVGLLLVGVDGVYPFVRTSVLGDCLRLDPGVLNVRGRCENHGQLKDWVWGRRVRFLVVAHRSGPAFGGARGRRRSQALEMPFFLPKTPFWGLYMSGLWVVTCVCTYFPVLFDMKVLLAPFYF